MIIWQEPPAQVERLPDADALGRHLFSASICRQFGTVDFDNSLIDQFGADSRRRIELAGGDGDAFEQRAVGSFQAAMAAFVPLMEDPGTLSAEEVGRRRDRLARFMAEECPEAARSLPGVVMLQAVGEEGR